MKPKKHWFFLLPLLTLFGCNNNDNIATDANPNEILKNITENIVLSNTQSFQEEAAALEECIMVFAETTSEINLKKSQEQWKKTASAYAKIYAFNIGRPKELFMHQLLFNWNAFGIAIENTIKDDQIINPDKLSTKAKGLTGIEYLLFPNRKTTNQSLLQDFLDTPKRISYLNIIAKELNTQAKRLLDIWNIPPENYASQFINNNQTGLKSSNNMLFNGILNVIESVKKAKLGKPAGLEGSSNTDQELLQAFRSGFSLEIIKSNIKSLESIFNPATGLGINSQLNTITGSETLSLKINQEFNAVFESIDAISLPLYLAIDQQKPQVKKLYEDITQLTITLSTDASSALSIIVTPTDNDGD